jgi:SNF2 family DNA or RNA helicase
MDSLFPLTINLDSTLLFTNGLLPHQAKYLAYELSRRGPAGNMDKIAGALADARVDLNPHQVEAALFAFKSPLSNGAILADEVGLGKTIEAGILLSQFWAEGRREILLIMPASLRKQWSLELAEKFYLPTHILEARSFSSDSSHPMAALSRGGS